MVVWASIKQPVVLALLHLGSTASELNDSCRVVANSCSRQMEQTSMKLDTAAESHEAGCAHMSWQPCFLSLSRFFSAV